MIKKVYEPVYQVTLYFSVGDWKRLKKRFNLEDHPEWDGMLWEMEDTKQHTNFYVLYVENKKSFYTLSHEICHLVMKVFEGRGVIYGYETEEAFAYYHTFWLKKLWRIMGKR